MYAAAVRDWLGQQALPTAYILGHSLGGKVAMELALTEPSRVGKLVVADMALAVHAQRHRVILDTRSELGVHVLDRADPHAEHAGADVAEVPPRQRVRPERMVGGGGRRVCHRR